MAKGLNPRRTGRSFKMILCPECNTTSAEYAMKDGLCYSCYNDKQAGAIEPQIETVEEETGFYNSYVEDYTPADDNWA